jgi:hypothetical protein
VELDAGGFDRHAFLCGQSGSGKWYSLRVLLEQLLLETDLRIVVLDPHSDCVRLPVVREGADAELAARWRALAPGIAVRRVGGGDPGRLHLRFFDLDPRLKAAVARLDPIRDRDEYGVLLDLIADEAAGRSLQDMLESLSSGPGAARALGARIRNLGLLDWPVWTQDPADELGRLATDITVRIAAEGRKFGINLLISTQRPQKVHENVLSQADNLILMRMNSAADLAHLAGLFSFVPPSLGEARAPCWAGRSSRARSPRTRSSSGSARASPRRAGATYPRRGPDPGLLVAEARRLRAASGGSDDHPVVTIG